MTSYFGPSQPSAGSGAGLLGRLGAYFGSSGTPAYGGVGQPTPLTGAFGGATPAYAAPPPRESQVPSQAIACTCACMQQEKQEEPACPIDPEALAAGQIAIVIPRQGP